MDFARLVRGQRIAMALCGVLLLPANTSLAVTFQEFVDPHPAPGNEFGSTVVALSTGNVVITSPFDDFNAPDAGAVYLFNGATGALISTLYGAIADDHAGRYGVTALVNGNYVVKSCDWGVGSGGAVNPGAVTWGSGTTGVSGVISAANSLVGTTFSYDEVGCWEVTALPSGNYVVRTPRWSFQRGAVTWGSGTTGVSGQISAANSLVGSSGDDLVGSNGLTVLTNGNYVVHTANWNNGAAVDAGASTWGSGTTGVSGVVSAANSLVGSTTNDHIGASVVVLANGNYVVRSAGWHNGAVERAGAVTWGNGTTGVSGPVSAANSLVGSTVGDVIGGPGAVTALANGNYVVTSPSWHNGPVVEAGAATWGNGNTGVSGVISAANSLVGTMPNDQVGSDHDVTALTNGNYVVVSPSWDNGVVVNVGAATWGNGTTGITGVISAANSLIGSTAGDGVGASDFDAPDGVVGLTNGNYVVRSQRWNDGAVTDAGAVTWGNGMTGVTGVISVANSLVGSTVDDQVGKASVTALPNGNYVVRSPLWNNGAVTDVGAATWGSGTSGVTGVVSAANSLVGSTAGDQVSSVGAKPLTNGNYVVRSPLWNNGGTADAGAASWGSGTTGVTGIVSAANSLVGSTANDQVGAGEVAALVNGNYLVRSPFWDNGAIVSAGAVTWGSGTSGATGLVSSGNSVVGSTAFDQVGRDSVWMGFGAPPQDSLTVLSNGNYVFISRRWDNGAIVNASAATWGSGTGAMSGTLSSANSLVGTSPNPAIELIVLDNVNGTFIASFPRDGGGRVRVGSQADLPPAVPAPFTAAHMDGVTYLHWGRNGELDIGLYNLYRGAAPNFTPAPENRISSSPDTGSTDVGPAGAFYKLSAVDVNGNESGFALITPGTTVGVDPDAPVAFALYGARPNPVRGAGLHVSFALPTGAPARFELMDVSGRRVLVREVGSLGPGRHTVNLAAGRKVAPGLYWLRLTQTTNQRTTRVTVIE